MWQPYVLNTFSRLRLTLAHKEEKGERQVGSEAGRWRNRLALGVGSSQVKSLSGPVGMSSKTRGRGQRRSLLTHRKLLFEASQQLILVQC